MLGQGLATDFFENISKHLGYTHFNEFFTWFRSKAVFSRYWVIRQQKISHLKFFCPQIRTVCIRLQKINMWNWMPSFSPFISLQSASLKSKGKEVIKNLPFVRTVKKEHCEGFICGENVFQVYFEGFEIHFLWVEKKSDG